MVEGGTAGIAPNFFCVIYLYSRPLDFFYQISSIYCSLINQILLYLI